jgi:predicted ATP-dependent endonuclease of OLD family
LKSTTSALAFFTARINNVEENKRLIIKKSLNNVNEKWKSLRDLLPVFFLRTSDRTLNSTYSLDQAKKELDNPEGYPNSLLSSLVKIIGIDKNTFLSTIQPSTAGSVQTIKARVNRKIDSKINNEFNKFYFTENVCLSADFDAGYVIFNARTGDGETLRFDERSNGLRWYMNLFIDIVANELSPSNVIYLFDEPGISLHVNAQNELLKLFVNLAEKGNQIVYTTHLPTMLNLENGGIHKIRSVSKDITGITTICNKAWNPSLSPKSQADTLAPIIQAIGMNINSEFGPSLSKINVICEGPSDYIYLKTFYKYLYPDENGINFIPSQGVSNCIHICNILQGWGCKFVAIFDFDAAGIDDGYTAFDKMGLYTFKKEYMFIKDVSKTEIDSFTPSMTFMIEDLIGRESLQEFISENGLPAGTDKSNKVLLAKLYAPSIIKHSDKASQNCLDKFRELFERIKATQLD